MKLLVIGTGQLGTKIVRKGEANFEIYHTYLTKETISEGGTNFRLDKTSKENVLSIFAKIVPDVIVDTAALHNVDYCETHHQEAWNVNVEGTKNIAEASAHYGAKMIFVSTDYVFDGVKGYYNEEDPPNPINYYGHSKLMGEKIIKQICKDYVIARPSVIYSWIPPNQISQSSSGKPVNFATWLIGKLKREETVNIVTDQYSSPTFADDLADMLLKLAISTKTGIFHTAGKTCISRYDFSLKIAEILDLDKTLIKPITSDKIKQVARRPMKSCLDVNKIEHELKVKPLTIDEALFQIKEQLKTG